jgi:serine/threonine protein kinase
MAPEQIEGESVDQRTDIYSLGITAFEMATGRRPFENLPVQEILRSHKEEPIPNPQLYNPNLPVQFSELLLKATQKDPEKRHQSVAELLEQLMLLSDVSGFQRTAQPVSARKLMNIFVSFPPEHQTEMSRLVEEFGFKLARLGSSIQVYELENE